MRWKTKVQEGYIASCIKMPRARKTPTVLTFVDLFCGIGGFRYGMELFAKQNPQYAFRCIQSVDIKRDALDTYNLNFKEETPPTDIRTVKDLPHFDILCAGFPCQPFSSAGKKEGFDDQRGRGDLIFEVLRICTESKPTYVLLENVSNIERIDNGKALERIVAEFAALGYHMTVKKINALDVGLAQDRARVFIVGCTTRAIPIEVSEPARRQTIADILDATDTTTNLPPAFVEGLARRSPADLYGMSIKDKRGGAKNIHSWDLDYHGATTATQKTLMKTLLTERRKKGWAEKKGIVWMDGMPLTLEEIRTFLDYPELEADLADLTAKGYLVLEHPKDLVNGKRVPKLTTPQGYNICKGKLSFPLSKILDPAGNSPTLTATDSNKLGVVVGATIRRLNTRELKALCGFPESMVLPPSANPNDVFGNMVCPPVVTALLDSILRLDRLPLGVNA